MSLSLNWKQVELSEFPNYIYGIHICANTNLGSLRVFAGRFCHNNLVTLRRCQCSGKWRTASLGYLELGFEIEPTPHLFLPLTSRCF